MAEEVFLEVDFGVGHGKHSFLTVDELRNFLTTQQTSWDWLQSSYDFRDVVNHINTLFNNINYNIPSSNKESLARNIHDLFINEIPLIGSDFFKFLEELRNRSTHLAYAALSCRLNIQININKPVFFEGIQLYLNYKNQSTLLTNNLKIKLNSAFQNNDDLFKRLENQFISTKEEQIKFKIEARNRIISTYRNLRRREYKLRKEFKSETEAELNRIKQTEEAYRLQMQLQAPVEYWETKQNEHRRGYKIWGLVSVVFTIVAIIALPYCLYQIADHAINISNVNRPATVYLILATMGIALTTIVFWIGKILTRLFLSERHLYFDAKERAVMIQTYLALTKEGQADSSDKSIILGALFRPTEDGIVRDDGTPELSQAALLAKTMAGK